MIRFLKLTWFDIKGFIIIKKTLREHKKTVDFNKLGLRTDWICRIYTVINPNEEDKGDSSEVLKIKAQERMIPIHKYITKIGLSELVAVSAEQIPDPQDPRKMTDSYLVVYYPIMRIITTWGIIKFLFLVGVISSGLFYYTHFM